MQLSQSTPSLSRLTSDAAEAVPNPDHHFVFVYGSLLSGSQELFHNHEPYLCSAEEEDTPPILVGEALTEAAEFVMVFRSGYNFPYCIHQSDLAGAQNSLKREKGIKLLTCPTDKEARAEEAEEEPLSPKGAQPTRIKGEVWRVGSSTVSRLDSLEGHPTYYRRRTTPVVLLASGSDRTNKKGSAAGPQQAPGGFFSQPTDKITVPVLPSLASSTPATPATRSPLLTPRKSRSLTPPKSVTASSSTSLPKAEPQHTNEVAGRRMLAEMYLLNSERELSAVGEALSPSRLEVDGAGGGWRSPIITEVKPLGDWRVQRQKNAWDQEHGKQTFEGNAGAAVVEATAATGGGDETEGS